MRSQQIEYWVLDIADRVDKNLPIEDDRVELKSVWPTDHYKAARRIAGHLNASRGDDVLWIIGLDESRGVIGVEREELSDWWSGIARWFDGIVPSMQSVNVVHGDVDVVVGLLFSGDMVPYLIKNRKGEIPHREVPWREGNDTRTARRYDLLRLLVPVINIPDVEIVQSVLRINPSGAVEIHSRLYIFSNSHNVIAIPFHKCDIELLVDSEDINIDELDISVHPLLRPKPGKMIRLMTDMEYENDSVTINSTSTELLISGSGSVNAIINFKNSELYSMEPDNIGVKLVFIGVGLTRNIIVNHKFEKSEKEKEHLVYKC